MSENTENVSPPLGMWGFLIAAGILGGWLTAEVLWRRLFGQDVWTDSAFGLWSAVLVHAGLTPENISWLFLELGLGCISAGIGVYLRQSWGYPWGMLTMVLCALQLGWGTPLALVCVWLLNTPGMRRYLAAPRPQK